MVSAILYAHAHTDALVVEGVINSGTVLQPMYQDIVSGRKIRLLIEFQIMRCRDFGGVPW